MTLLPSHLRLKNRKWYPGIFLLAVVASLVLYWVDWIGLELMITLLVTSGGLVAFLYQQHAHETQLFMDLFREFNRRYDEINGGLQKLLQEGNHELSVEQRALLVDYFNLCAEEFLFWQAGYVDEQVWQAWSAGMRQYENKSEIRKFWETELKTASYYGFTLGALRRE